MSYKVLSDPILPILNLSWYSGVVVGTTISNLRVNFVSSEMIRSRPIPTPLDVTNKIVVTFRSNLKRYDGTEVIDGLRYGREGSVVWVYDNAGTPITQSDDGIEGLNRALALPAGRRAGLGETFAEGAKTVDMFAKRTAQLARFAMALKRGDVKAIKRILDIGVPSKLGKDIERAPVSKRLSDLYLELAYGWKPVVETVGDSVKLYGEGLRKNGQSFGASSGSVKIDSRLEEGDLKADVSPLRSMGGFKGKIVNSSLVNANETGLLNFGLLAYQLYPLSFVFDWLLPVGTYLGALTGTAGLGEIRAWRIRQVRDLRYRKDYLTGIEYRESSSTYRERLQDSARPSLAGIKFQSSLQLGQAISLAALTRQRLG